MRIALLSAGPSLLRFRDEPESGGAWALRIGVNRAACRFACDWWSAGDAQTIRRHAPADVRFGPPHEGEQRQEPVIGRPCILTLSPEMEWFRRHAPELYATFPRWLTWEQIRDSGHVPGPHPDLLSWSAPMALALAVVLAAEWGERHPEVHCFGVDMQGDSDFTGEPHARFSKRSRWQRERAHWDEMTRWAIANGTTVIRHSGEEAVAA